MFGHSQFASHAADFVLEQPLQRLAQTEVHLLGQTAHIVMALDGLARNVQALDAVGINGALRQPAGIGYLVRFGIEDLDKIAADDFTFLLRLGHSLQILEELLTGIHANHVQPQTLVVVHHIPELILTKQPVVHKDTGQVLADGTMQQHGGYRRIHTATQSQDNAVVAKLLLQFGHSSIYKRGGAPALAATANVYHEVAQHLRTVLAVEHFRMELHTPHLLTRHLVSGNRHLVRRSYSLEVIGNGGNRVSVAHPHLAIFPYPLEKDVLRIEGTEMGTSVLASTGGFHPSTVAVGDKLRTVADTQNGVFSTNPAQIYLECTLIINRKGATRKDNSFYTLISVWKFVVRYNLAIDIQFAQPAADELRGLRTEIKNNNLLLHINPYRL